MKHLHLWEEHKTHKDYQEEKSSTFIHNDHSYSVNKLLKLTKNIKSRLLKVSDLEWILEHTTIDKTRVKKADLSYPLIVIKEKDKWIVLDGAHRLSKAVKSEIEKVKVKVITPSILKKCKIK